MINITDSQYEAIGRVAVESGTLERELEEYFAYLRKRVPSKAGTLGPKLEALQAELATPTVASSASAEFATALSALLSLVNRRNAVVHGVWSSTSNAPLQLGEVTVKGRKATLHAKEVAALAAKLRTGRMLLLRLFHEHFPTGTVPKRRPQRSSAELLQRLLAP